MAKTFYYIRFAGFLAFLLCAAINLAAQEESALIYRVEGDDFAVTVNGSRTIFPAAAAGKEGVRLERSGIVHTGPGVFLEMQLVPSGTVIKLSENTSLVYNGIDGTGNFADLGLLYGRIRVVSGNARASGGASAAVIRSGGVSARMTGSDLGADYVLEQDKRGSAARPLFRVYAFRGGAELFPYGKGGTSAFFGGAGPLSAAEGECLSVDISGNYTFAEKEALGDAIKNYWALHNFDPASSPLPMPDTAAVIVSDEASRADALARPPVYELPPEIMYTEQAGDETQPPAKLGRRGKNQALALGLILTASALALQGAAYSQFNTAGNDTAHKVYKTAYIPMGLGLVFFLGAALNNSSAGE